MTRTGLICLAASLALAGPLGAQTPAATAQAAAPDPARLASARALIKQMNMDALLDAMFVQIAPMFASSVSGAMAQDAQTKDMIAAVNAQPQGNERMTAILSQEFMTAMKAQYGPLKEQTAVEYATSFTKEELDAITGFYSSGPGAKALRLMPQLQQRMAIAGQKLGQTAGAEAGQRAFERIGRELLGAKDRPRT